MCKINLRYTNRLIADGLEQIIKSHPEWSVVCAMPYKREELTESFLPEDAHMTLIELDYPKKTDIEYIKGVLTAHPHALILMLTSQASVKISRELIQTGISGYLLKSCSIKDLENAIEKILDAKSYFCTEITKRILNGENNGNLVQSDLSDREKEILRLIASNQSIPKVANKLNISENTVKTHKKNILSKLGVQNTMGLFLYAIRHEMVDAGDHDLCNYCPYFCQN